MKRMSLTTIMRLGSLALIACLLPGSAASAGVLFSYDASGGQLPTEQGWSALEVDLDGPLTASNVTGSPAEFANAAMETYSDGLGVLHIRDTLTGDSAFDLPTFFYPWTPNQQQALAKYGLKLTMLLKGQQTSTGGKGNVRLDLTESQFEDFDNIDPGKAVQLNGLSAELLLPGEEFNTLVITGEKSGTNDFVFTAEFEGETLTSPLFSIVNSPNAALANSIYFGASSSGNTGTDVFVRSIVVETLNVPEPAALTLAACGALIAICRGWSRKPV